MIKHTGKKQNEPTSKLYKSFNERSYDVYILCKFTKGCQVFRIKKRHQWLQNWSGIKDL